jgi:hypothetical protein
MVQRYYVRFESTGHTTRVDAVRSSPLQSFLQFISLRTHRLPPGLVR